MHVLDMSKKADAEHLAHLVLTNPAAVIGALVEVNRLARRSSVGARDGHIITRVVGLNLSGAANGPFTSAPVPTLILATPADSEAVIPGGGPHLSLYWTVVSVTLSD